MKKFTFDNLVKNYNYYNYKRVTKSKSKNKIAFDIFTLTNNIDDQTKNNMLQKYNNIAFGTAYYKHTPNIKHTTILIFDKKLTN